MGRKRTKQPPFKLKPSPIGRWLGSKRAQVPLLLSLAPKCRIYCEVFAGAAWLAFNIAGPEIKIINDKNWDVINTYQQLADNGAKIARALYYSIASRTLIKRFAQRSRLSDLDRAYRFLYFNRVGFNARPYNPSYATRKKLSYNTYSFAPMVKKLLPVLPRLKEFIFNNEDFQKAIERYDSPETFFYIDPPYMGCERYYGKHLYCGDDFNRLACACRQMRGKFLMSHAARPEILELFRGFNIMEIPVCYRAGRSNKIDAKEYLIANYDLPLTLFN